MILTGRQARVVQVHPTRRCNLECLHCYSLSGPAERAELHLPLLCDAIEDAAAEGYNVMSVSGGEPLLYTKLMELLDAAIDSGMATTIVTNGTLLTERRVEQLAGRLQLIALSVDGTEEVHDHVRGRAGAFAMLEHGIERIRAAGIRFAILFTLTMENAPLLPQVARFAAERGAAVLQVHCLEETGRAALRMPGATPSETVHAAAWIAVEHLRRRHEGRMEIHLDVVDRRDLGALGERDPDATLAELVSPLVIEPDGVVVPLQYGFPRRHALGSLREARLSELAARWRAERYRTFEQACLGACAGMGSPLDLPFVSLYQEIARRV